MYFQLGSPENEINLISYHTDWNEFFNIEKLNLEFSLDDNYYGIEHIGSTAIKNIKAQPIIDIVISVKDIAKIHNHIEKLKRIEYKEGASLFNDARYFYKGDENRIMYALYFVNHLSDLHIDFIQFRDYLIQHSEVASVYSLFKEKIAKQAQHNKQEYFNLKTEFIKKVLSKTN